MRTSWMTMAFVAAVAAAGVFAGRAIAKDEMGGMPPPEKQIDGTPLVKALMANKWTTKATGSWGDSEGTVTFQLAVGKTVLLGNHESKGGGMVVSGMSVMKIGEDGKTGSMWWFDSMSPTAQSLKGTVSDNGYEMSEGEGEAKTTIKLAKKGEGFEFSVASPGGSMTETYTKAK